MNTQNFRITGSLLQAYIICPRQAWLMSRNINGDQFNEFIAIGRLFSEISYKREKKEIYIGNNKIDVIKKDDDKVLLIETKKSSRGLEASKVQLLYYLYCAKNKISNIKGEIRIPKEKKIFPVELSDNSITEIEKTIQKINNLFEKEKAPDLDKSKYCGKCSYQEFCWA